MSTKVKGEAIKEGSIPLSALAEDVKGEFDGKYGFDNYIGKLSDVNPKIETNYGRVIIYIKYKNLIYNSSDVNEIILNSGPKVVIKLTKLGYKTIIEIVEGTSNVGYYGPIYLYEDYNKPPTVTPDWNAQEGDAGYIENKPFYTKGDTRQIDVNGEYEINVNGLNIGDIIDISWDIDYYNDEIFRGSTSFVMQTGETIYYEKDGFSIIGMDGEDGPFLSLYAYSAADSHYGKVIVTVNGEIKTLEEKYIPDTVLKTTPQTLTDSDKNQALANLGIDPVVWKYLCRPFIFTGETTEEIPSELMEDGKLKYKIPAMYRINVNNNWIDLNSGNLIDFTDINQQYGEYTPATVSDNALYTRCLYDDYIVVINILSTGKYSIEVTV